jgi:hypothetical protein
VKAVGLLTPVLLAHLLLAAHFLRAGSLLLLAATLVVAGLLAHRGRWTARLNQLWLLSGSGVWAITLMRLWQARIAAGAPAVRMAVILGAVALFTALAAGLFETGRLRERYRLTEEGEAG